MHNFYCTNLQDGEHLDACGITENAAIMLMGTPSSSMPVIPPSAFLEVLTDGAIGDFSTIPAAIVNILPHIF